MPCRNMKSYSRASISAFCLSKYWSNSRQGEARSSSPPPKTLPVAGGGRRSLSLEIKGKADDDGDDGMAARGVAKASVALWTVEVEACRAPQVGGDRGGQEIIVRGANNVAAVARSDQIGSVSVFISGIDFEVVNLYLLQSFL